MATKSNDSCLEKAASNEPVFTLRAQDWTAPVLVMAWILMQFLVDAITAQEVCPSAKLREAFECALKMREWRPRKFPD